MLNLCLIYLYIYIIFRSGIKIRAIKMGNCGLTLLNIISKIDGGMRHSLEKWIQQKRSANGNDHSIENVNFERHSHPFSFRLMRFVSAVVVKLRHCLIQQKRQPESLHWHGENALKTGLCEGNSTVQLHFWPHWRPCSQMIAVPHAGCYRLSQAS